MKSSPNPDNLLLLVSDHVNGKFERVEGFDDSMGAQTKGMYEAPTAVKLADGAGACLRISTARAARDRGTFRSCRMT